MQNNILIWIFVNLLLFGLIGILKPTLSLISWIDSFPTRLSLILVHYKCNLDSDFYSNWNFDNLITRVIKKNLQFNQLWFFYLIHFNQPGIFVNVTLNFEFILIAFELWFLKFNYFNLKILIFPILNFDSKI